MSQGCKGRQRRAKALLAAHDLAGLLGLRREVEQAVMTLVREELERHRSGERCAEAEAEIERLRDLRRVLAAAIGRAERAAERTERERRTA